MNEDFIPKEIALKLKEKGFDWRVGYAYDNVCNCMYTVTEYCVNYIPAPTISQVLKWLREEKKIHIQILFTCPPNKWEYITVKMTNNELRGMCATFTSYEQAAVAGIEYSLYNLI